jgi:ABC-type nitrate/sulfonate/bicarbonate transport system substrate-binding protein
VLEDSSIKSAQDLKGKTIAVNTKGAHLDYTIREYLRRNGLTTNDVNLMVVPGPQLEQVLRHKQANVVAVGAWQTVFAGKIEAEGGVRVLFTDYDILGDIVLGSAPMLQKFVARHPEAVKKFVSLSARAVDWATTNPEEARELVAKVLQGRGENPELARYWSGWGLREHALYTENDTRFWLDTMVREGKLKPGQLTPEEVQGNKFNSYSDSEQ